MLIKAEKSKALMDFLKEDFLINLNTIGIIKNEPEVDIFVDNVEKPKGVVVYKDIDIKDTEVIDAYYEFRGDHSLAAIKRDILNRPSSGVYVDGELVCWVLTHDDNSLGIMYTKEEHRRKGYAVDVTIDIASKHIAKGSVPYLQIIERNNMSPGLAKKCGFVECGEVVWFGIKVGNPSEE